MALLFADGFDHYLVADLFKKWTFNLNGGNGAPVISPAAARPPGGMGIQFTDTSAGRGIYKVFGGSAATLIVGVNIYTLQSPGGFLSLYDSSGGMGNGTAGQFTIGTDGSGHLRVWSGATTLFTSTNVMSVYTWYHIEAKVTINNSTGVYEVRVNGSSTGWVPQQTGANTRQQTTNAKADAIAIQTGNTGGGLSTSFDDLYVLDTTGSGTDKDFLGPQKIITCYPSGPGSHADFTGSYAANFANVNETTGDGDATFNQSATANNIDSFVFDDVPSGTINAIQHVIQARQDAGGPRVIAALQRSGSTDYVSSTQPNLAGSHVYYTDPKSQNPDTSANWTTSDFNAAEFGYKLIS